MGGSGRADLWHCGSADRDGSHTSSDRPVKKNGVLGEQLQLALEGEEILRIPWEGRSPRALTRGSLSGIFETRGGKSVSDFVDPAQVDLFEALGWKQGPFYEGALPLIPLPGRFEDG